MIARPVVLLCYILDDDARGFCMWFYCVYILDDGAPCGSVCGSVVLSIK